MDHKKILQSAEEACQVVQDLELRKIAFQEIVRSKLQNSDGDTPRTKEHPELTHTKASRARVRSRITRALGTREIVNQLDISPDEKGLPEWLSLSQDWKKFCWILEAARQKGVDGLTGPEISFLIERVFRERFSPAQVNNLKKKIRSGYVRVVKLEDGGRMVDAWRILAAGTAELKKPVESISK